MRSSTWWIIGGVICLIVGFLALLNPLAGTIAATALTAWGFLIAGILQIVGAFMVPGSWNKAGLVIFGIAGILVGIALINHPLAAVMSLTMAVAILILVSGVVRLFVARDVKGTSAYGWVIVSAIASLILGIMILASFPVSAKGILGILMGLELIFTGVAMFGLSRASKIVEGSIQPA